MGDWRFSAYESTRILTFPSWQGTPYGQDAGSTFSDGTMSTLSTTTATSPSPTLPAQTSNLLDAGTARLENTLGQWSSWYSAAISNSNVAHTGTGGLRVDVTAPYGWGVSLDNWPGFSASPGAKTIGFHGKAGSGNDVAVTMRITWRNDAGSDLQVDKVTLSDFGRTWKGASAQAVAPLGTTKVWVELVNTGPAGRFFFLDDFVVAPR